MVLNIMTSEECCICDEDTCMKCIYCNYDICSEHASCVDHDCAKRIKNICWKCKTLLGTYFNPPKECDMCNFNFCEDDVKQYCERCDQLRMIKNNQKYLRLGQKLENYLEASGCSRENLHNRLFHISNEEFMKALNEDVTY